MTLPAKLSSFLLLCHGLATIPVLAQNTARELDQYCSVLAKNHDFNGNILVADRDKIIYERSFGYARFNKGIANTVKTAFLIASVTKTFTSTAILQLAEQGKWKLTDPVAKYLPGFPYPDITLRHLLSHTSGLPPYDAFFDSLRNAHPDTVFTNADFLPGLLAVRKPLLYNPGSQWNYDNVNFIVLGILVEKITGLPIDDYITTHILNPLGMKQSFFPSEMFFNLRKTEKERIAQPVFFPHLYAGDPVLPDTVRLIRSYWHSYHFRGFGELASTTHDLWAYSRALFSGKLLNPVLLQQAFTPQKLADSSVNPANYGLGWVIVNSPFGKIVHHTGEGPGINAALLHNLDKSQTIIVLDNRGNAAYAIAYAALEILNGRSIGLPKKNGAMIFSRILIKEGEKAARLRLEKMKQDTAHYRIAEDDFNTVGYDLMGNNNPFQLREAHHYAEALIVFQLNTLLFPDSWNVYDSYGEALEITGNKIMAISMFKRSLQLNPQNTNATDHLKKLE